MSEGRYEIRGPSPDSAIVEAWADAYIPFDPSPGWQKALPAEIKTRCKQLEPSTGQVLHATFYGDKRPNADVENVVLYNIDSSSASLAATGFASNTVPLRRWLPLMVSIRSATAMRSRRGRAASLTGSRGERWRRSTGPTWGCSLATRSPHRCG